MMMFSKRHTWLGWIPVVEPGVDERWSRLEVTCKRCGEVRRVWKGVDREQLRRSGTCQKS